jgi:hypothetical protein
MLLLEMWREILCVVEARTVAANNTVAWNGQRLQLPESRLRPHFAPQTGAGGRWDEPGLLRSSARRHRRRR